MKRKVLILIFSLLHISLLFAQNDLDALLLEIDKKIANRDVYMNRKEQRIDNLKIQRKAVEGLSAELYKINMALFEEYKNYSSDSAIHYLNLNMDLAEELKDVYKLNETSLASAFLFVRLGMYKEASDILETIKLSFLSEKERLNYNITFRELYLGIGYYGLNVRDKNKYWEKAKEYDNYVKNAVDPNSEEFLRITEKAYRLGKQYDKALEINGLRLQLVEPNTVTYALVTFHRSLIFRKMGDVENEKKYLALSALSDMELAIKDNASISILADILAKDGDINRAYNYIRFSLDNIKDFNTRIRSSEILNIQNIIDKEYQLRNEKKSNQLKLLLIIVSVLSVCLLIAMVYVYKQMKKGQLFSIKLKDINAELELFNGRLHDVNKELISRNREVAEANHIKEEYIAYFLDECSKYITKLDDYRRMVHKKMQEKQYEKLYNITRDNSLKEEELKELFVNFDFMFINLFPNFLTEFNALLLDEERIFLKKEKELNTELRIFALIRLGINDSSKIANFLGYSVNTIYNYRTKMKNRAKVSREDFELRVRKIGTFV